MIAFSALSDPTRCRIVEMLAEKGKLPVAQIKRHFPVSAPAISQHLKILKKANLVQVDVKAQQRIYSLNPKGIGEIDSWVSKLRTQWDVRFTALDRLLKTEVEKTKLGKKREIRK